MKIICVICALLPIGNNIRRITCLTSTRLYLFWQMFTQLHFTYEQESHQEEFFIPYVWQLVLSRRYGSRDSYSLTLWLFVTVLLL